MKTKCSLWFNLGCSEGPNSEVNFRCSGGYDKAPGRMSNFVLGSSFCVSTIESQMAIFRSLCKTNTRFFWHPHCTVSRQNTTQDRKAGKGQTTRKGGTQSYWPKSLRITGIRSQGCLAKPVPPEDCGSRKATHRWEVLAYARSTGSALSTLTLLPSCNRVQFFFGISR